MFTASGIAVIREVVASCRGLSGKELANTLSEWLGFVDAARYSDTCYRAANWVEIGETSGRGRGDHQHRLHGAQPKRVLAYRLRRDAQARLRGDSGRP